MALVATAFELMWALAEVYIYNVIALIKFFVPAFMWPHKDVHRDIVLITGGGSGIGRLMSLEFGKLGSTVIIWDIDGVAAQSVVKEVRALGGKAYSHVVDCCKSEEIYKFADKIREDIGHVTILVNNAGVVTGKKFLECPDRLIRKTMDVNINAHFWTLKAFLPRMLERNHGHIVTVSSMAGFAGGTGVVDYSASKFAAVGLDDALYHELIYTGKTGVKCTLVCPFFINTGMFEGVRLRRNHFLDILEPEYVVQEIMTGIRTNKHVVVIPRFMSIFPAIKNLMTERAVRVFYDLIGLQECMNTFRGRGKAN